MREDFGEVHGAGVGVLGDLFAAAEAVADKEDRPLVGDALDNDPVLHAAEGPGDRRRPVQGGRSGQPDGYGEPDDENGGIRAGEPR